MPDSYSNLIIPGRVGGRAQVLVLELDMILPKRSNCGYGLRRRGRSLYWGQDGKGAWQLWHRRRQSWGELNQRRRDRGMRPAVR